MAPLLPAEPLAAAPDAPGTALMAAFEHRVLTRDAPDPTPLAFDEASVCERLGQALRARLGQRDPYRRRNLASICYQFLASPTQLSTDPALAGALGLSSSGLNRTWRELRDAGLVEAVPAGRQHRYRLTRAGEDWLLAAAKGEAAGQ